MTLGKLGETMSDKWGEKTKEPKDKGHCQGHTESYQ